ncbi:MAG: hypothetical protein ACREA0_30415 [bacterium]
MLYWLNNNIRSSIRHSEGMDGDWGDGGAGGQAGQIRLRAPTPGTGAPATGLARKRAWGDRI